MQKRRNTTRACEECRRRRAKCDGKHPSCSRCTSRSQPCTYPTQSDGRKPAPKSYVEMLRKRIDILERVLKANALDVDESIGQILQENTEDPKNTEKDSFQNNMYPLSQERSSMHTTALSSGDAAAVSRSVDLLCDQIEGTLTIEKSLNFDQDGEIRYFGPSSGRLHFQTAALCDVNESSFEPTLENSQRSGKANIRNNQLIQSLIDECQVTDDLKYHLIKLYFTWEQPWCCVVDERLFRESEKSGGRFCSPLLLNCILALGSRFTDRVEVRSDPADPNTAGNIFLDNAAVLLHYDLKWPSITTIQALSIMGTLYVAQGADASGWLYQGMANRLAIDMGFNLDAASTKIDALISAEEVELRRQIYWALYCVDKLSASYTGRVCTFLTSQGAVNLPGLESNIRDRKSIWSFDTDEDMPLLTIRTDFFTLHHSLIKLCRILETILLTLYAPKPLTNNEKKKAFLLSCALELRTWYYDLPPDMRIDHTSSSIRIPHVFTVHMVYHTAIILLYKPFLTDSRPSSLDNEVSGSETRSKVADDISARANHACYQAAKGICAVSQKYRHIFGSFRRSPLTATHCNLMAALILVQSQGPAAENKKTPFHICVQVLEELSTSWNPAQRLLQNVLTLHRNSKRFETSIQEGSHSADRNISQDSPEQEKAPESQNLSQSNTGIIDFHFPEFQTQVDHYDMTDSWMLGTDLTMTPHLTGDALNFSFDYLPGDYGIFDLLNHTNSQ